MTVSDAEFAALKAQVEMLTTARRELQMVQAPPSSPGADIVSAEELNTFYLMWAGALVFLMQAGFAVLSAGSIRAKNVKNILLKNLLDACVGAVVYYLWGYGLAYDIGCASDSSYKPNGFIGWGCDNFALSGIETGRATGTTNGAGGTDPWITFFFQYAFAAAAATIVSGAVAERCQLLAYLIYTTFITGFIYPVVVHWVWDSPGFLCGWNKDAMLSGVIDFAGSGVVHMTGGWAALMGAMILGPRIGRWTSTKPWEFEGHSSTLQVLGTFILWFGWYGFNPGSTLGIHNQATTLARTAVCTTLSAASAGILGLFIKYLLPPGAGGNGVFDLAHTCNSILGGLVGITAGCATVPAWAAVVIGLVSAFVYHGASCTMRKAQIDDPLDAWAVHGACGAWGMIAVGLFTDKTYSYVPAKGNPNQIGDNGLPMGYDAGIFMPGSYGVLFGTQVSATLIMIIWVTSLSGLLFGVLRLCGILRVSTEVERAGCDLSKHGGAAYPEHHNFMQKAPEPPKSGSAPVNAGDVSVSADDGPKGFGGA
jgi:Amt family ammonium transporter